MANEAKTSLLDLLGDAGRYLAKSKRIPLHVAPVWKGIRQVKKVRDRIRLNRKSCQGLQKNLAGQKINWSLVDDLFSEIEREFRMGLPYAPATSAMSGDA